MVQIDYDPERDFDHTTVQIREWETELLQVKAAHCYQAYLERKRELALPLKERQHPIRQLAKAWRCSKQSIVRLAEAWVYWGDELRSDIPLSLQMLCVDLGIELNKSAYVLLRFAEIYDLSVRGLKRYVMNRLGIEEAELACWKGKTEPVVWEPDYDTVTFVGLGISGPWPDEVEVMIRELS